MGDEAALGTVPQPQKVGHRVSELLTALTVVWWLYLHGEVGWISLGQELCVDHAGCMSSYLQIPCVL